MRHLACLCLLALYCAPAFAETPLRIMAFNAEILVAPGERGGDIDQYTCFWDRNENGAKAPYDVFSMIDHIFLAKELMLHVKLAFIFHTVPLSASDHYPVVVDLVLPER